MDSFHVPHAPLLAPAQLRAARALLGFSRDKLAKASGVSAAVIAAIETAARAAGSRASHDKLRHTFDQLGVVFVEDGSISRDGGPGVRIK